MTQDELVTYGLAICSAACIAVSVQPLVARIWGLTAGRFRKYQKLKVDQASKELDDIFMDIKPAGLKVAYGVVPIALGLIAYATFHTIWLALPGVAIGIIIPDLWLKYTKHVRRQKFQNQLVDSLFILSSSLKAGLSLMQAFEQLALEMTAPASQEFGLVIKAHRLGRTLEGALEGLNNRIQSDELRLVTTAILLARETGGDITHIIQQLITTIRERKKLYDKVMTLTVQGRMQAYIMSILPVAFAFFVRSFNANYFDQMLSDHVGQLMMAAAVVLWIVGIILLQIMSKVEY